MEIVRAEGQVFASKEKMNSDMVRSYQDRDYSKMDNNKLKSVSQEFESLFINQLFKSMRSTVPKDTWLNGGLKQEIFEDMLYEQYSQMISKRGGIGLGDMVYRYLTTKKS